MEDSPYLEQSDEELVKKSLSDQKAFAILIDRYQNRLLHYIHKITSVSHEEAEDILQEAFIKAYYNLHGFDPDLSFSSWIYRIVRNQTISAYRKRSIRPQGHSVTLDDDQIRYLASELDTASDVDIAYLRDTIGTVLDKLDVKYRDVLVLRYFEEKDYQEISAIIKKSTGTVSSLVSRAKKQFKKEAVKLGITI